MKGKNRKSIFFLLFIFLFLFFSCKPSKKEEILILDKKQQKNIKYPYKPLKISILYSQDSILITKTYKTGEEIKYKLYKKSEKVYFLNKRKTSNGSYSIYPYLLLKNHGHDSCYSVSNKAINTYNSIPKTQGIDVCFSRVRNRNFITIARFNTKDSMAYSESIFHTKEYKIYQIAIRINDTLFWYKIKK